MAMKKDFTITVPDEQEQEKVIITELTELTETNKNTIYNLIFSEEKKEQEKKQ